MAAMKKKSARGKVNYGTWGKETVRSNRVQSSGTQVTNGGTVSAFYNVKASDALQGGRAKTKTPSTTMAARQAARKVGEGRGKSASAASRTGVAPGVAVSRAARMRKAATAMKKTTPKRGAY